MSKLLKMTPEWVLLKIPNTFYADGLGNAFIYTDIVADTNWIELALDSINLSYKAFEDYYDAMVFGYEFLVEDIQGECPVLYEKLNLLNINNQNYRNND